tara:strand:+ start:3246 stop:4319 length:1074 start_codon:yes stop_codon:yes gene_type:complete
MSILSALLKRGGDLTDDALEYLKDYIRSSEGYGALKDLVKPVKTDLDPAGLGGTRLPDFVEDIEYKTTDQGILIPEQTIDISELQGRTLTPAYGDRTYAGKTLDAIAGVKLNQPVEMQGGNEFMRLNDAGLWASEQAAMKTKAKAMSDMDDPLMVYTAMSGQSGDFSKMMSDATMGMIEQSKITKKAAKSYDDLIKKNVDSDWVGILNPKAREYINNMSGSDRRLLWQFMDKDSFKKQGFPDLGVIRAAITDPALLTTPSFTTGRSIGALDSIITQPSKHKTYNTEVVGEYLGSLPKDVPGELIWRDFFEEMAKRKETTGKANPQRAFLMTPSIKQKVDQQMVDEVSKFTEILKGRN